MDQLEIDDAPLLKVKHDIKEKVATQTNTSLFTETLLNDRPKLDQLKQFIQEYDASQSYNSAQKDITAFIDKMVAECVKDPRFTPEQDSKLTSDDLSECWEKLLLTKLNQSLFALPTSHDAKLDKIIEFKIQKNYWVLERHLDLPFIITSDLLSIFKSEIYKINTYRAPKDKLTVIHNAIQILTNCIEVLTAKGVSNDYLLPSLVIMLIRCKVPLIMSNIKYIKRFRNQAKLEEGSTAYHLTTLVSALSFICNCKIVDFTMSDQEALTRTEEIARFVESKKMHPSIDKQDSFADYATNALNKTGMFFGGLFNEARSLIATPQTPADPFSPINQDLTPPEGTSRVHSRIASLTRTRSGQLVDADSSPDLSPTSAQIDKRKIELEAEMARDEEEYQANLAFALALSLKEQEKEDRKQKASDAIFYADLEHAGIGRDNHINLESPKTPKR